mgnify:CR=1 FL=1
MATNLKVSQRYPTLSFFFFIISLILTFISLYNSAIFIKVLLVFSMITGIILFMIYLSHLHKHMAYLTEMCTYIIDQKEVALNVIDDMEQETKEALLAQSPT